MVLENTIAPDGTVRDSLVICYMPDPGRAAAEGGGVFASAASDSDAALPAAERAALEDLAAALLVAVPQLPEPPRAALARTVALARTCHGVPRGAGRLDRWRIGRGDGAAAQPDLAPLRLQADPPAAQEPHRACPRMSERARQLLATIPPTSPFYPFRQAVEAAVPRERVPGCRGWEPADAGAAGIRCRNPRPSRLDIAVPGALVRGRARRPRRFVQLPDEAAARFAAGRGSQRLPEPVAADPGSRAAVRKEFSGPCHSLERLRIKALAAEARGDWAVGGAVLAGCRRSHRRWDADRQAQLSQGRVYSHLAHLADRASRARGR